MSDMAMLENNLLKNKPVTLNYVMTVIILNPTEGISPLNFQAWLRDTLDAQKAKNKPGVEPIGYLFLTEEYSALLGKERFQEILSATLEQHEEWIEVDIVNVSEPITFLQAKRHVDTLMGNDNSTTISG